LNWVNWSALLERRRLSLKMADCSQVIYRQRDWRLSSACHQILEEISQNSAAENVIIGDALSALD
jgi:hypothetical protein